MKLLFDFLPIFFFFIAYILFGIYPAIVVAIVTSGLQVMSYWVKFRRFDTMQVITFGTISILGGATLIFRNPLFFMWKPTIAYWVFGGLFLVSQFMGKKPFLQRLMDSMVTLPHAVWQQLNFAWAAFFILLGFVNLYVAYHYSMTVWVYFKFIGALGATLVFVLAQSLYMMRYLKENETRAPL